MKKIFVAGASGYLGYFICKELIDKGYGVSAMARDASEEPAVSTLKELGADVCFINLMENGSFSQIPSDCDAVISCLASTFKTAAKTGDFWKIDRDANIALFEETAKKGIKRFVLLATYEGRESRGVTAFSEAKEQAVDHCEKHAEEYGITYTIIRPTAYFKDLTKRIWDSVKEKNTCTFMGDGSTKINPIHGEDAAKLIVASLDDPAMYNAEYPLGGPETLSFKEIGQQAAEVMGTSETLKFKSISPAFMRLMIAVLSFLGIFSSAFKVRAAISRWALFAFSHDAVGNPHGTITIKDEYAKFLREEKG
jgi:divinyl chlorophyllide a 8-vinyl-reductase